MQVEPASVQKNASSLLHACHCLVVGVVFWSLQNHEQTMHPIHSVNDECCGRSIQVALHLGMKARERRRKCLVQLLTCIGYMQLATQSPGAEHLYGGNGERRTPTHNSPCVLDCTASFKVTCDLADGRCESVQGLNNEKICCRIALLGLFVVPESREW